MGLYNKNSSVQQKIYKKISKIKFVLLFYFAFCVYF